MWLLALMVWVLAIAAVLVPFWAYKATPGEAGETVVRWPADTGLSLARNKPTLLVFLHPKCACSRASMSELARLLARIGDRVSTQVLFTRPEGVDEAWTRTPLWDAAASVPSVQVSWDDEGREGRRFGATTSGHVVLYDPEGALLFSGGITTARGHEGESEGAKRIVSLVERDAAPSLGAAVTKVFGCGLRDVPEK